MGAKSNSSLEKIDSSSSIISMSSLESFGTSSTSSKFRNHSWLTTRVHGSSRQKKTKSSAENPNKNKQNIAATPSMAIRLIFTAMHVRYPIAVPVIFRYSNKVLPCLLSIFPLQKTNNLEENVKEGSISSATRNV